MFIAIPSKIVVSHPSFGLSPAGFHRVHLEMPPREVARLVGYDPRTLVMKPRKAGVKVARGTRDLVPHNVSLEIVALQNKVQRSIDTKRVAEMVEYLTGAMSEGKFADWSAIELVTSSEIIQSGNNAELDADADYFIADGQHRYCALIDFVRQHPEFSDRFTQGITISVLPEGKLIDWAGQKFHDHNYFSVPVRAGKALAVDTRDPVNALAKELDSHPVVIEAGGVAYDRDTLLNDDARFASHSTLHRFVRGFLFGRSGLDKHVDTRAEVAPEQRAYLWEYLIALREILPWAGAERDAFLTRTSVVLAALAVVGNDLYKIDVPDEVRAGAYHKLAAIDWRRTNLALVGVVGSEKNGLVQPASSRQAIDGTIRFLREQMGLLKAGPVPNGKPGALVS